MLLGLMDRLLQSGKILETATKIELKPKKYQKAAWLVSNCHTHSEREHYVEELRKYFPVGKN